MATCNFKSFGLAGGQNLENHLCVLAPNALSEKIFVILWFWYGLLALITGLNLLLITSMMFPSAFIRKWYLARAVQTKKVHKVKKVLFLFNEGMLYSLLLDTLLSQL